MEIDSTIVNKIKEANKKSLAKKTVAKKTVVKKTVAAKTPAKKAAMAAKKSSGNKSITNKKTTPVKKAAVKKASVKKKPAVKKAVVKKVETVDTANDSSDMQENFTASSDTIVQTSRGFVPVTSLKPGDVIIGDDGNKTKFIDIEFDKLGSELNERSTGVNPGHLNEIIEKLKEDLNHKVDKINKDADATKPKMVKVKPCKMIEMFMLQESNPFHYLKIRKDSTLH